MAIFKIVKTSLTVIILTVLVTSCTLPTRSSKPKSVKYELKDCVVELMEKFGEKSETAEKVCSKIFRRK